MTSSNLITSLASMTLTAFLASKKSKTASILHTAWFSWQQEPQQPQWPQQPQEPQWPQWPQQPLFIKKLWKLDDSINPSTKMTYPGLSMWNGSSKIHYFIDFWHCFCWRLWRPRMLHKPNPNITQILVYFIPLCLGEPCSMTTLFGAQRCNANTLCVKWTSTLNKMLRKRWYNIKSGFPQTGKESLNDLKIGWHPSCAVHARWASKAVISPN